MATLGTLRERPVVGDGPRGLQRRWQRVGLLPARPSRARRLTAGERTGSAAICDRYQLLCFSMALWNGHDPILKERLFGLTPDEANHGEDVKEYYFYVDSTPTHSYMKYLYKYPQREYPYGHLSRRIAAGNPARRSRNTSCSTRASSTTTATSTSSSNTRRRRPEDFCIRIEVFNRGPEAAPLHIAAASLVPQHVGLGRRNRRRSRRSHSARTATGYVSLVADDTNAKQLRNLPFEYQLGQRYLYAESAGTPLFTNNETNAARVWGGDAHSRSAYREGRVPPLRHQRRELRESRSSAARRRVSTTSRSNVPAGGSVVVRLRLIGRRARRPDLGRRRDRDDRAARRPTSSTTRSIRRYGDR